MLSASLAWRLLLRSRPALFHPPLASASARTVPPRRLLSDLPGPEAESSPARVPGSVSPASVGREEKLFSRVDLELRAHQPQVLKSYAWFIEEAARHLDVTVTESEGEPEPHKVRKTLLKSAFVHSKHRVQYEIQTFFWIVRAERLTESTRDTFLEYIQRNLPEGVAMKVTCKELMRLPKAVREDISKREKKAG